MHSSKQSSSTGVRARISSRPLECQPSSLIGRIQTNPIVEFTNSIIGTWDRAIVSWKELENAEPATVKTDVHSIEARLEAKHLNPQGAYYGIELCFNDKGKSMYPFLNYRASDGVSKTDELGTGDIPISVQSHFVKEMVEFFGNVCDEHNETRAIHYARAYIQEKVLSAGREGRTGDYMFEQVSDMYDEFQNLVDFCTWTRDLDDKPTLFGKVAERI